MVWRHRIAFWNSSKLKFSRNEVTRTILKFNHTLKQSAFWRLKKYIYDKTIADNQVIKFFQTTCQLSAQPFLFQMFHLKIQSQLHTINIWCSDSAAQTFFQEIWRGLSFNITISNFNKQSVKLPTWLTLCVTYFFA